MDAKALTAWRVRLSMDKKAAAVALGMSPTTYAAYERGQRIPRYVALACAALAYGLPPIGA